VFRKFLILVSILLLSTIVFSMVGGLLAEWVYGIEMLNNPSALSNLEDPNVVSAMKLLQLITTGIGMFLVPSVFAAVLFYRSPKEYLSIKSNIKPVQVLYTVLIMIAIVPLINIMVVLNHQLSLPEFLSFAEKWMKDSEANAARITKAFLVMNTTSDLLYNMLIVAIVPAIGEELLFRGVLQRLFQELTRNIHVTVFVTAALFSAIHMQFYGFLPRMFLGVMFGYLLVWSGSIWVPVLAHFVNNGAAVLFSWYASRNELPFDQDTIGTGTTDLPLAIFSVILVTSLVYVFKKGTSGTDLYALPEQENEHPV
jgi:uncharacterized protein